MGNQLRIALLVIVAAAVGVGLWLAFGHTTKKHHKQGANTSAIGPWALTAPRLKAEALALGQPMYWAGPMRGMRYEFTRTTNGHIYVRYLPKGVKAGAKGGHYLIVATYSWSHAYKALKKVAKGRGVRGPRGSLIWVRPKDPRSILIAWPKVPYEVEVFDPRPAYAAAVAESGQVKIVG